MKYKKLVATLMLSTCLLGGVEQTVFNYLGDKPVDADSANPTVGTTSTHHFLDKDTNEEVYPTQIFTYIDKTGSDKDQTKLLEMEQELALKNYEFVNRIEHDPEPNDNVWQYAGSEYWWYFKKKVIGHAPVIVTNAPLIHCNG